jgi:opacity protein-like surface antigen
MRRILLLLLFTASVHAQTTVTGWLSMQRNGDGGTFPHPTRTLTTDIENGRGFGASIARQFGSFSGELAVFRLSSEGRILENGQSVFDLGDVELTPVMAMVRYHVGSHLYVGAGAAYVMTDDIDGTEIDSETAAVFGAGITYDFSPRWGVALDARYLPLSVGGRPSEEDERVEANLDPLIVSAGLRVRF